MITLKDIKLDLKYSKQALKGLKRPNKWHLYHIHKLKAIVKMLEKVGDMPNIHLNATKPMDEYHFGMHSGLECMRATLFGEEPKFADKKYRLNKELKG